jgi:hypothetical protein
MIHTTLDNISTKQLMKNATMPAHQGKIRIAAVRQELRLYDDGVLTIGAKNRKNIYILITERHII